ncbi:hypothetical protein [Azonexus hydrophilus]|uniref:hypothetical protein n=1 Tax=Azonexus hydrophilus TaxID=418702 RepID=UPI000491FE63|nr:hypothetical protein [Azonexus hydrophilus]
MNQTEELIRLVARVEELDKDVQQLRNEFEDHIRLEDKKYNDIKTSIELVQLKVDQVLIEIKEPLESYKTAKYGMGFLKYIVETAKWLAPLVVGLMIGYGFVKDKPAEQQKEPTYQMEKVK